MVRAQVRIIPDSVFYRRDIPVNLSLVIPHLRRRDARWNNLDNRIKPADERKRRPQHLRPDATLDRRARFTHGVYTFKRSDIRDVLLLRTHGKPSPGPFSRGPGLSKKRSRSGKFSNAITPPPCVCLDKGIMRFYASHACFVDLQRCLCTQRHTSRLPTSSFSSTVPLSWKNSLPHTVGSFSDPPLRHRTFFSFHLPSKRPRRP